MIEESESSLVCKEPTCEALATTAGFCREHYIKNWEKIKQKEAILKSGRLSIYVRELADRYPETVLEAIRKDLMADENLEAVIKELEESAAADAEDIDEPLDQAS